MVLDIFAGSGTTAHAVANLNEDDGGSRKFLIFEANEYIHSFTVPRLLKSAAASKWRDGVAGDLDGTGLFIKVQILEQYEDTLENLDLPAVEGESLKLPFEDPAFALRWRLERAGGRRWCGIERFRAPFGWHLQRVVGATAMPTPVDLVESLPYLLGLTVTRLWREPDGVVLCGRDRRDAPVVVLFRDCDRPASADWVQAQLAEHPQAQVYTNDPASLRFPGAERLLSLETVFASQFP